MLRHILRQKLGTGSAVPSVVRAWTALPVILFLSACITRAAVWPDQLGTFAKTSDKSVTVSDGSLWEEYGLKEVRVAEYAFGEVHFRATASRFSDPTGALAAFQWQRPADARPSALGKNAVETPGVALLAFNNYLFRFEGRKPAVEELQPLFSALPQLDQSSLPALSGFLPEERLIPNSQRFVVGPNSLDKFEPRIPPSVAAFHYGAEAQFGRYKAGAAEMQLGIFSYPTPQIARQQLFEFQKLPGAMAKRSGPLIAVVMSPANPDEAERLLSKVRYEATVSWTEHVPNKHDNIGSVIVGSIFFSLALTAFGMVVGIAFGGLRVLSRLWLGREQADQPMILLNLRDN